MNNYQKYIKYKHKYLNLKKQNSKYDAFGTFYVGQGGQEEQVILEPKFSSITLSHKEQVILEPKFSSITDANNNFTIVLFENLDGASNIISPLSITFAISLLHLASIGNTNKQLTNLLGYKYSANELEYIYGLLNNSIIKMTNALIINKNNKINKEYVDMVSHMVYFINEDVNDSDLVIHKLNRYIEKNTDGMIKDVISDKDITLLTNLSIVNTIYFKASWQHKFNTNDTTRMKFHHTETNMVNMMHQINYFNYYENKTIQMVELPYDENDYAMGIILPRLYLEQTSLDYLINNVPRFTTGEINEFINNMQLKRINLYLPKFVHRKNIDLVTILKKMGVTNIFSMAYAKLDAISPNIFVSKILHDTVVIVDEMGTEAINKTIEKEDSILFKANHAFIYYIRHVPTNLFLFYADYQGN